jgi:hypothetical protein
MTSLRERAAGSGQISSDQIADGETIGGMVRGDAPMPEVDVDTSDVPANLDRNVHLAWAAVMADVQAVAKGDKRQDAGGRYNFRGIDRILNAVGPAFRKHGVACIPEKTAAEYSTFTTGGNRQMRLCTVTVDFRIYGPRGDSFPMQVVGEAFDAGDKAAPKAQSVALRVALINALAIPTEDPAMDADRNSYEIEAPRPPTADEYAQEIQSDRTSLQRLYQIRGELGQHKAIAATVVTLLDGAEIKLSDLLSKVGAARKAAAEAQQ